jgi:hypothetical protein
MDTGNRISTESTLPLAPNRIFKRYRLPFTHAAWYDNDAPFFLRLKVNSLFVVFDGRHRGQPLCLAR